ncbi:MAG TPA: sensor histidine kinase [Candidatus Dormibacteraeota bacterium]|nr:sensor histidine kinase [Candidatus Dormibacteraeota bacterium]
MRSWRDAFWGRPAVWLSPSDLDTWERRYARVLAVLPYALLGVSTLVSQVQPYRTPRDRLVVIGLAMLAAGWVFFMYSLPSQRWRESTGPMLVYFIGLLTLSALLESRSEFFIAFAITGFVQAFFLLPSALAFLAVAATSCLIYLSPPNSSFRNIAALPVLVFIVGLQTVTVGGGSFLGAKISQQQAQRRRLMADLEAAQEENAGLHAQLLTQAREAGVLDERQRLAREIHDTLAQGLTGIVTQLEAAEASGRASEQWQAHLAQASALARESLREARRSLQALQPEPLEGSRLPDAIAEMAGRWSETTPVALSFGTTGRPVPLLTELEVALFRVAQEALANVARHASASRVDVTISYTDDLVLLDVRDDGVGFTPGAANGFGLRAMGQRLRLAGGKLEVESAPGAGTALSASVPAIAAAGGE